MLGRSHPPVGACGVGSHTSTHRNLWWVAAGHLQDSGMEGRSLRPTSPTSIFFNTSSTSIPLVPLRQCPRGTSPTSIPSDIPPREVQAPEGKRWCERPPTGRVVWRRNATASSGDLSSMTPTAPRCCRQHHPTGHQDHQPYSCFTFIGKDFV